MSIVMECAVLTNTDLRPSSICLGTGCFGSSINRDDAFGLMDAFLDAGGSFLDTAHIYADWQCDVPGVSERTIGEWISSRACRERMIIATKGGHPAIGSSLPRLSPEEIYHDLKESLRRLRIERIDLYWLHKDDHSMSVGQILDTLESARQERLIRWYGASNWSVSRLREAAMYAELHRIPGMVASQIRWSLAKMNPESPCESTCLEMDEVSYRYHQDTGMPVVAYSSQAGGFFGGEYSRDKPESGRPEVRWNYASELNWGRLKRACKLAKELGCTANQIALAYLIAQPFQTFPIVGCRELGQLMNSCDATNIHLTSEQVDYVDYGKARG